MEFGMGGGKTRGKQACGVVYAKRPDIDNLAKFYLDVLNGFVFADDGQVARLSCVKVYSSLKYTQITITTVNHDEVAEPRSV